MELRKQKEIEYYDKKAQEWLNDKQKKKIRDFEGLNPFLLGSYNFLRELLKNRCEEKKLLDYGCGNGIHSIWLAKHGLKVTGIDLSEYSLQIAKENAKKEGVKNRTEFLLMDCENLKFTDKFFDIIFDGGTFSSLDLDKALPGLARVLKPDGFLIGIETLGHNPFTNLKRKINKLSRKRTSWAADHIFKMQDFKKAEQYFNRVEKYFFHILSWIVFPCLKLPGGRILLKLFEKIDKIFFLFPFLRRYAFKTVFIFSEPKNK